MPRVARSDAPKLERTFSGQRDRVRAERGAETHHLTIYAISRDSETAFDVVRRFIDQLSERRYISKDPRSRDIPKWKINKLGEKWAKKYLELEAVQ